MKAVPDFGRRQRLRRHSHLTTKYRHFMTEVGVILLIIGFIAKAAIIWTIGIILVVIGAILALPGFAGHAVGRRKHSFCTLPFGLATATSAPRYAGRVAHSYGSFRCRLLYAEHSFAGLGVEMRNADAPAAAGVLCRRGNVAAGDSWILSGMGKRGVGPLCRTRDPG
jgi:hypothetical protein